MVSTVEFLQHKKQRNKQRSFNRSIPKQENHKTQTKTQTTLQYSQQHNHLTILYRLICHRIFREGSVVLFCLCVLNFEVCFCFLQTACRKSSIVFLSLLISTWACSFASRSFFALSSSSFCDQKKTKTKNKNIQYKISEIKKQQFNFFFFFVETKKESSKS